MLSFLDVECDAEKIMDDSSKRTWLLFFVRGEIPLSSDDLLTRACSAIGGGNLTNRERIGRPFLVDDRGMTHRAANKFFAGGRMRNRAAGTNRKYAYAFRTWINFLELRGSAWDTASEDDLFSYKFWRRTDPLNPRSISGSTWNGDLAALGAFYDWSERMLGVSGPFLDGHAYAARGSHSREMAHRPRASTSRSSDVKWLSPGAYRTWRDVGIHGIGLDGQEKTRWRPRCQDRDAAFVDGLYGTGLRLQEWASVVISELHEPVTEKNYATHRLSNACAKGGRGHSYWIRRDVLNTVWTYVDGERRAAIRRGQMSGAYERLTSIQLVEEVLPDGRLVVKFSSGETSILKLRDLTPVRRSTLFSRTSDGLVPLALWLNEDGLPRSKRSWYKAFDRANTRVARAGIDRLQCHPHMLRHSFALRWYAVGRIAWEQRKPELTERQTLDFRDQFGDTWSLVQTMLGHSDVNTTKSIYLEPFLGLDVNLLMEHGTSELQAETLLQVLRSNSRVRVFEDGESIS
ncbi:hypothetical protein E3O59_02175 [Cryobacterium sp. MDB2-33-2]|nr:hypothetical protein E3O59_02175 [Cryobacterium sp. MDB2-33-2]